MTSLLTVATHYPIEVIDQIADPFSGLASQQNRLPTPYDVRQMAERLMATRRDQWRREELARRSEEARREAERLAEDRKTRPTIEQIEEECAARGLYLASYRKRCPWLFGTDGQPHGVMPEAVRQRFGLSPLEWDLIPDRPHQRPSY